MANKNWLLLIASICLVIADKFSAADARPRRISVTGKNQFIRFQPINHKQYDSIMELTAGKPVISEGRLINSGYRSLSSISQGISDDFSNRIRVLLNVTGMLLNTDTNSGTASGYPLCVINVSDLTSSTRGAERSHSHHSTSSTSNSNANANNNAIRPQFASSSGVGTTTDDSSVSPSVRCIVVVRAPTDAVATDAGVLTDVGALTRKDETVDCDAEPDAAGCCDPQTDDQCPGYCRYNRMDPMCIDMDCRRGSRNPACRLRRRYEYPRRRYSNYPGYARFAYPHAVPRHEYSYAYAPETIRDTPTEVIPKKQHFVDNLDNTPVTSFTRKEAATIRNQNVRAQKKRFNKPAMIEESSDSSPSVKETTRAGYDNTQIYQQLYNAGYGQAQATYGGLPQATYGGLPQAQLQAAYGGVPEAQAAYGYNPYTNYQFNPYAGGSVGQNLRFPPQYQQQMQMPYGNLASYAAQNNGVEDSSGEDSGEYSGEEENDDARSAR